MTIESDLEEIKQLIKNIKSTENLGTSQKYRSKIQGAGKCQGKERYSIYVTKSVNKGKLTKGDIVEYSLNKVGHKAPRKPSNDLFRKKQDPETASDDVEAAQSKGGSTVSKIITDKNIKTKEDAQKVAEEKLNPNTEEGKANEEKDSEAIESSDITEEEQEFLNVYNSFKDNGKDVLADYHQKEAEKQFGKERVEELLK